MKKSTDTVGFAETAPVVEAGGVYVFNCAASSSRRTVSSSAGFSALGRSRRETCTSASGLAPFAHRSLRERASSAINRRPARKWGSRSSIP